MKHSAVTPQPLCTQSRDLRRHHEIVPTSVRTPSAEDRAFIQAMNEFTAKAGLLSDDPYFGGL